MLDEALKTQLQGYLTKMREPITLLASLDSSEGAREMRELLHEIAQLSNLVQIDETGTDARTPSFVIAKRGETRGVRFACVPLGHEFSSLVLALLWTSGHPPKVEPELLERIRTLAGHFAFEAFVSLSCHSCPEVVQALTLMCVFHPSTNAVIIDGSLYQAEAQARDVMAVPTVYLNDEMFGSGRMLLEEIVAKLDVNSHALEAQKINDRAPFDVLIVGGGPAGAAAGVYAARKGIRVGIAAERFGGQVNDTLAIENYISVLETDGSKFAAALEAQVAQYDVDLMNLQRAESIVPPKTPGGLIEVSMSSGAKLTARSVILTTGARWREVGVPGEKQYKNKGVAYCPHCDGPLYKNKRVAVIGGGNSGVEAAIDLAGVASHVLLVEFADALKADSVLVKRLLSLSNVDVQVNAQTLEITGDGSKVNGLSLKDRATGEVRTRPLEGVFVQIGLVPNTEWLKGAVDLTRFGEINVDAKGHTNIPGVFAAGDCTTTPFKQIVIAAGDGAKAALSAFDYLIRLPVLESELASAA